MQTLYFSIIHKLSLRMLSLCFIIGYGCTVATPVHEHFTADDFHQVKNIIANLKALRKNDKNSVSYVIREDEVDPQLALYHHLENFPDSVLLLPDTMHKMTHDLYRFGYTKNKKIIVYSANDKPAVTPHQHQTLVAQGFHKLWWKTNSITEGIQLPLDHVPADSSKDVIKILTGHAVHKTS